MDIAQALHRYRIEVEEALNHSKTYSFRDLLGMVESGELIGYANDGAVLICEPIKMKLGWMLAIFVAAGEHDAAMQLVERAEDDARRAQAVCISAIGRQGWMKDARKRGYRVDSVIYIKEF